MKILFGMPSADSLGGVVASEPPIAEALRRSGVTILSEDYVYGTAVEIGTLGRIRRVVRTALRFRKVIRDGGFDIIHLNSAFDKRSVLRDAASIFLIGRTKARVFLKVHGASLHEFTRPSLLYKVLIRYLGSRVDGFGIHTEDEMNGLERLGLDRERFHVILNSVVVDDAKPQGYVRIQKEPSDSFKLLFAGRFVETKGLLETIRACARLQERGVRFTLECCGDGPLRSAAELLVGELGLTELVDFRGFISRAELGRLTFECDALVFPTSHPEGFPIVLFDAIAAGMPVVTTRIRAAKDFLSEPDNCLFSTNDPANVADRLEELIGDVNLRSRMSENNVQFGKRLSPERLADDYIRIYEAVLKP